MDQSLQGPTGGASVDWRGLCEELADALACHYPGHVDDDELVNRVRAELPKPERFLAPQVTEPTVLRPTDRYELGELVRVSWLKHGNDAWCSIADDVIAALAQPEPERYCQMIIDVQALAKRWNLPAPWLGKLVSEVLAEAAGIEGLKKPSIPPALPDFEARAVLARFSHQPAPPVEGEAAELVAWLRNMANADLGGIDELNADRAADLLERQAAPVPDRLPELRGMFERILCVARSSDQKPVGNIELADRLIKAVVSWGALPVPQGEVK